MEIVKIEKMRRGTSKPGRSEKSEQKGFQEVAHHSTRMLRMVSRSGMETTFSVWDRLCGNFFGFGPVLDGKMLDVNVTKPCNRDTVVDQFYSKHIAFVKGSRAVLAMAQFQKDRMGITCMLCSNNHDKNFSFGIGLVSSGLSFREVQNNAAIQEESKVEQ